ncbi:hypothetical protein [Desulforamulus aquiferis]|uniref:t-SNARE coiled-coil homology domain-containing protein n=1 Tax=Desulforamulus aquiferis TaxID=1397668 RepID=A0AAW7ZAS3_9FIRM|nr:hypothetical protein [Desulforamulus aquiferis]MDO7786528.1 hypothetical protein [Desulforamulus aquiferis]
MAITIEKLPDSEQEYYEGRNELKTSLDLIVSMINDTKSELRHLDQERHKEYLSLDSKLDNVRAKIDSTNSSFSRKIDRFTYGLMGVLLTTLGILAKIHFSP